jgi:hypothetical protein
VLANSETFDQPLWRRGGDGRSDSATHDLETLEPTPFLSNRTIVDSFRPGGEFEWNRST